MKHIFVAGILLVSVGLLPTEANAQTPAQNGFSLGLSLGDPTGLTLRNGFNERDAVQAAFGFSFFPGDAVSMTVDWTHDAWDFLRDNSTASLLFFFGIGGKAEWFTGQYFAYEYKSHRSLPDQSHFGLGVRGLVGLRLAFRESPFDLFMELAPVGIIFVVPDPIAYFDIDFSIGFRYRF